MRRTTVYSPGRVSLLPAEGKDYTKDFGPERSFCAAFTGFVTHLPSQFVGALGEAVVPVWQAANFLGVAGASLSWQRLLRLTAQRLLPKEQRELSLWVDAAHRRYERSIRTQH